MKKKNNYDGYYFERRRYHIFRGILVLILLQIFMMVPVLNLYLLQLSYEDGRKGNDDLWHVWYDLEKVKIKRE